MLQAYLKNFLEDNLPLTIYKKCWFHQYGAPVHNARHIQQCLSQRNSGKRIGSYIKVSLKVRSMNFNPLDFSM